MKLSMTRWSVIPAVLGFVVSTATFARADMGSAWVDKVGSKSITVNWTDPTGNHRLYRDGYYYRISWEPVNPYENTYPNISSESESIFKSSDRPFTISGLDPSTYYRIRVEGFAEKQNIYGEWINPKFRLVSLIRQKTQGDPAGHLLRLAQTGRDSVTVEFVNPPPNFDKIRFAYKQKWSSVHLVEVAGNAVAPPEVWETSDALRGWVDQFPAPVLSVDFKELAPGQAYEVVVFGHQIGITEGVRLGSVSAETAGFQPFTSPEAVMASDHQDVLAGYCRRISAAHGGSCLYDLLAPDYPILVEDKAFLISDEGDDLTDNLTMILFLISARPAIFSYWQLKEESTLSDLTRYVTQEYPHLPTILRSDMDPKPIPFHRGDVDSSMVVDISDSIRIFDFLFLGAERIECTDAADSNDDGKVDLSDAVHLLQFLFLNGPEPAAPFDACGDDPTLDALDCAEFTACAR